MAGNVELEMVEGGIARVRLNRPEALNAQSPGLIHDLDAALEGAAYDDSVKIIVLSGNGKHFSAGHDVGSSGLRRERAASGGRGGRLKHYQSSRDLWFEKSLKWRRLPKPTLAMVHGYAIWGGWIIASSMDLIFASDDALFLGTHFQYFSIPWDLGARKTMEVLYQNRFVTAEEACTLGLVNRVIPRAELEAQTLAYAREVAENDLSTLMKVKNSVLEMQDIQGFTAHVYSAYHSAPYGPIPAERPDIIPADRRRSMPNVERALRKLPKRPGEG